MASRRLRGRHGRVRLRRGRQRWRTAAPESSRLATTDTSAPEASSLARTWGSAVGKMLCSCSRWPARATSACLSAIVLHCASAMNQLGVDGESSPDAGAAVVGSAIVCCCKGPAASLMKKRRRSALLLLHIFQTLQVCAAALRAPHAARLRHVRRPRVAGDMASDENSFFGLKVPEGNDRRELYKSQYRAIYTYKMSAQDLDQAFREAVTADGPDGGWSIKNDERVKYVGKLEVAKGEDSTLKARETANLCVCRATGRTDGGKGSGRPASEPHAGTGEGAQGWPARRSGQLL